MTLCESMGAGSAWQRQAKVEQHCHYLGLTSPPQCNLDPQTKHTVEMGLVMVLLWCRAALRHCCCRHCQLQPCICCSTTNGMEVGELAMHSWPNDGPLTRLRLALHMVEVELRRHVGTTRSCCHQLGGRCEPDCDRESLCCLLLDCCQNPAEAQPECCGLQPQSRSQRGVGPPCSTGVELAVS